jgi:hypothetical protein
MCKAGLEPRVACLLHHVPVLPYGWPQYEYLVTYLLPPDAEYTDACMSLWLTHSLDKSTCTRHNIVSPAAIFSFSCNATSP